jgi:hypothetical protein
MQKDPEKDSLLAHVLADRRYAAMLGLGFSAGIPFLLVYVTQSAWLSEAKVPIETIGLMSELTIAYKFKFVWAPFLDKYDAPIFSAPRRVSFSVDGLNDKPLEQLIARFRELTEGELPRRQIAAQKAQLVVSPDRGYGKSHLLGRLFKPLGEEATLIYRRPFQDPQRIWSSILRATIQELERPNQNGQEAG